MADRTPRLGDVIDDYCPRCRLLLNHDVTSLYDDQAAKVTCRTCHNTHDYRHAQVPPKRKSSKKEDKQSLLQQVLASMPKPPEPPQAPAEARPQRRDLWAEIERIKAQRKGPA
jgi:hypothetical protein